MKEKIQNTKSSKGITLVALIITIVVLLILAAVAIGAVKNSDIIGYAQNSADGYEAEKRKENETINDAEDLLDKYTTGENNGGSKVTYTEDGVPVPVGFKVVTGTKDTGLVIENETEGSQFVWIPVEDINDMVMCKTHGTSKILSTETLQCPDCGANTELVGIVNNITTYSETNYREPDIVTYGRNYLDADPSCLSKAKCEDIDKDGVLEADDFKKQLENEYKAMVGSVNHYGGFYVGRYEVSINNNSEAQSKADGTNITSATAAGESADTWYGLYKLCKTYNTSTVKSSMIWGSQYDVMMTWFGVTDSSSVPGYNRSQNPGEEPLDVIRNVYDLYGSSFEWTLEAYYNNNRVVRGGCCNVKNSASKRISDYPQMQGWVGGSRLTLYVEV